MNFTQLPNSIVYCWIPRTGSTSVARALLDAFYPERLAVGIHLPPDRLEPTWQHLLPRAHLLTGQTIVGLIRDPVERFRSACARTGKTPAEGLTTADVHFARVSDLVRNRPVTWYRFPDQLAEFCAAVGLPSVPTLNDSAPGTKPDLTPEELAAVEEHYAADIALYEAGPVPPAPAAPAPEPVPAEVPLWAFRAALADAGLLATAQAAVAAANSSDLTAFFEYGNFVERASTTLASLAGTLGQSAEQVDALFRAAAAKKL